MRPNQTRRILALNASIPLHAQAILATTERAWQVQQGLQSTVAQAGRGVSRGLRGLDVAATKLVSRIYRHANAPLRAETLACLLRPLGTLRLAAVASDAIATLLRRDDAALVTIPLELAARHSSEQILERTHLVHKVTRAALEQLTGAGNASLRTIWRTTRHGRGLTQDCFRQQQVPGPQTPSNGSFAATNSYAATTAEGREETLDLPPASRHSVSPPTTALFGR